MSDAQIKNEIALARVMDETLKSRIYSTRLGIWSESSVQKTSGMLIAEALGELLGRFWRNIEVHGSLASIIVKAANSAAASGGQALPGSEVWNPPYDYVISIGCDFPEGVGPGLRIGASGWRAITGSSAFVDNDPNPVGPVAVSAIAAVEVFKKMFADGLGDRIKPLPSKFEWSVWDYGKGDSLPPVAPLHFNDLHIFGVGAVTHGMLWVLERWPAEVTGEIHLIDQDNYDLSNGQRYIGMESQDLIMSKSEQAAVRLRLRHNKLVVHAHKLDMNSYFIKKRPDCLILNAVVGVDSKEHRRHLGLKLPRRVVNMWTDGEHLGAARFGIGDGWPCLYCAYPEDNAIPMDETGQIVNETGLKPIRVRELLFSGSGLTQADIDIIGAKYGLQNSQDLLNKPLRSARGTLCATGQIRLSEANKDSDIPFAFSSLLAGIGGFIELLHETYGYDTDPGHWQYRIFSYPTAFNWNIRRPNSTCYLCSEEMVQNIVAEKYRAIECAESV